MGKVKIMLSLKSKSNQINQNCLIEEEKQWKKGRSSKKQQNWIGKEED